MVDAPDNKSTLLSSAVPLLYVYSTSIEVAMLLEHLVPLENQQVGSALHFYVVEERLRYLSSLYGCGKTIDILVALRTSNPCEHFICGCS